MNKVTGNNGRFQTNRIFFIKRKKEALPWWRSYSFTAEHL